MSGDKIEVSIKDIPEIIETLKEAEKEIELERKSKNLFIDNLYKVCDMSLKQIQEIERLHSIIKEVREYVGKGLYSVDGSHILEILDNDKE